MAGITVMTDIIPRLASATLTGLIPIMAITPITPTAIGRATIMAEDIMEGIIIKAEATAVTMVRAAQGATFTAGLSVAAAIPAADSSGEAISVRGGEAAWTAVAAAANGEESPEAAVFETGFPEAAVLGAGAREVAVLAAAPEAAGSAEEAVLCVAAGAVSMPIEQHPHATCKR